MLEDKSTNTKENMQFSAQLILQNMSDTENIENNVKNDAEGENGETTGMNVRVAIVTNNFHMYRALKIAKAQGFTHAEGLAAHSYAILLPNDMLRECLAVVKNVLYGNM